MNRRTKNNGQSGNNFDNIIEEITLTDKTSERLLN